MCKDCSSSLLLRGLDCNDDDDDDDGSGRRHYVRDVGGGGRGGSRIDSIVGDIT